MSAPNPILEYNDPSRQTRNRLGLAAVVAGISATPVALFLAFLSMAAGRGDPILARALFPYSFLSTILTDPFTGGGLTFLSVALGVLQFPLYGILIAWANRKNYAFEAGVAIATVHILAAIPCFIGGAVQGF